MRLAPPRRRRALEVETPPRVEATPIPPTLPFPVTVVADGDLTPETRDRIAGVIGHLARVAPRHIIRGRVAVKRHRDPALERPVQLRATLELPRKAVHAHVEAATLDDALDRTVESLRRSLEHERRTRRRA